MSRVKPSAAFIAEHAVDVSVDIPRCRAVAEVVRTKMQSQRYSPATWSSHQLNPKGAECDPVGTVDWIFAVDCLNFSFWSENDDSKFTVHYEGRDWTGYWSMVAAINRALDEKIPITSPRFWVSADFTPELLSHVFRSASAVPAPLLPERFEVLQQAGHALVRHGFASFAEVLDQIKGPANSALQVVDWVTAHIPSFNDAPIYHGRPVYIYKRAQILVADIWACFQGRGIGRFDDIDEITMFADYRVPQILVVLGCLQYSSRLRQKITGHELLAPGSAEEVEIRGCSIAAVEAIVEEIKRQDPNAQVNAVIVDFYLWDTAKVQEQQNTEIVECHRTRSIYY